MKKLNVVFTVLLAVIFSISATARTSGQDQKAPASKTESFKVWGNCGMCKDRIEKAVKVTGVTSASWDDKTKLLKVTYDPSKTSIDALSKTVAAVGHDTEKYKAPDDVYSKLPGCCLYDRAK